MLLDYVLLLSWLCVVQGKEGYFWHISDIHYDPLYSIQGNSERKCWNSKNNIDGGHARLTDKMPSAGIYGHYGCDSPWALIESAANAMKVNHGDGIEFVLWSGDALSHADGISEELRLQYLKNLTDLLSQTFTGQFVFPVLGHEDIGFNLTQIAHLWSHWLPEEALITFRKTGYYMIEQRSKKYRIISLNTNLWLNGGSVIDNRVSSHRSTGHSATGDSSSDPFNQWTWFRETLKKARDQGQAVYVMGHTPPGIDDRETAAGGLKEEHNLRYLQIVRENADVIRGQFFGHWHSDAFRVIYNDAGEPVSWVMVAPSITPFRPGGPNNPGLRLYKFDNDTGQVLDYAQYYLNLPEANKDKHASWRLEYKLREWYDLPEVTAFTLHDLADRFTQSNDNAFVRYYGANRVSLPREVEEIWGCGGPLNGFCALHHYCAVTRLSPASYSTCVSSYALYALASNARPSIEHLSTCYLIILMFVFLSTIRSTR